MKKRFYLSVIVILFMVLTGCERLRTVNITIELDEFSYSPNHIDLEVGQVVTLTIINNGKLEHEIMFGRTVLMLNGQANGFTVDLFEHAGVEPRGMAMMGHDHADHDHEENGLEPMDTMGASDEQSMHSGYMTTVDAENTTATIIFAVTEEMVGEWEIGCFLQSGSHYGAGMAVTLTVTN